MSKIITTTDAQKNIGKIAKESDETSFVVTSHGKGKMIILPYFDGCDQEMAEYMETYEMMKNKEKLKEKYEKSSDSGESSLVI